MPAGRPSTYTSEIADRFCACLACSTRGVEAICTQEQGFPHPSTIYDWLFRYPDFAEKYARAKEMQTTVMAEEILAIADSCREGRKTKIYKNAEGKDVAEITTGDMVERSKLMIESRKWLMGKLAAKKYGDLQRVDIANAEGAPAFHVVLRSVLDPKPGS